MSGAVAPDGISRRESSVASTAIGIFHRGLLQTASQYGHEHGTETSVETTRSAKGSKYGPGRCH